MKPAILFPVETTARELLYKLFLSIKFAEKGYMVYLGTKEEIQGLFPVLQSFVYFDKGYHQSVSECLYAEIRRRNGTIVNLDEEGGVDYEDFSTIAQRYSEALFYNARIIFLWGSRQYDFLKSIRTNFSSAHTVISGHPRFELLKPQYHSLYRKEAESLSQKYGCYILLNTNMGFGNNIRGDSFVRRNYGSRIKNIDEVIEFDKIKMKAYISLIKRLSLIVNKNIILRPHPEENHNPYLEAFAGIPNVKVIFEGSVIPWILGSELMVHPDCTTGIEAAFMGRIPVSYLPETDKKVVTEMPLKVSLCYTDENKCLSYISTANYKISAPSQSLLSECFSHDKNTSDIIVEETDRIAGEIGSTEFPIINCPDAPFVVRRRMKKMVKRILGRERYRDLLTRNKRKGLDLESLDKSASSIMGVANIHGKPSLKMMYNNLYCIKSQG